MESGFSAPPVAEERAEVRDRMVRSGDEGEKKVFHGIFKNKG